jgi:hypothetical protein
MTNLPAAPLRGSSPSSPSSPDQGTSISFAATIDFNGQPIAINTGDVSNGLNNLVFNLNAPVDIGSIDDFLDWLKSEFGVPFDHNDLTNVIDKIPSSPTFLGDFKNAIEKIFSTDVWITVLNVNVKAKSFQIGVTFPVDLQIVSFLKLNSIGVMVAKADSSTTSPSSP